MKTIEWNEEKNKKLQVERGVCFEDVFVCLINNKIIDVRQHINPVKYPNQKIFIVTINDYVHMVPFVEDEETIFLKTIIPSRKMTKEYLKGGK